MGLINSIKRYLAGRKPFVDEWRDIVREWFPGYDELADEERARFDKHLKLFLHTTHFFGAGELEVTEEMKVIVAASAARIARNLPFDVYERLTEVVLYPASYRHPERHAEILGEAHHWGTLVLSWDAVRKGVRTGNDGHDTAVHEFAHVLDIADGWFDGTPQLERGADYESWSRVMAHHFHELQQQTLGRGVLREYGATNEAEFFAVATEAFFEKPKKLKRKAPELYEQLQNYYQIDPVEVEESIARSLQ